MDKETLIKVTAMLNIRIAEIDKAAEIESSSTFDEGKKWAYREMAMELSDIVFTELKDSKSKDNVSITLSWSEYTTLLASLSAMKNMVDSEKLDALYVKLSTKYKGV